MPDLITPGRRLTQLANDRPDDIAVRVARLEGEVDELSWSQLEAAANRFARRLASAGVDDNSFVPIGLPNSLAHVIATWAIWKLGACPMPLNHRLPAAERDALLALAAPPVVVGAWDDLQTLSAADVLASEGDASALSEDPVPAPFKAVASGGSTGTPKMIVAPSPFAFEDANHPFALLFGFDPSHVVCSPGPLSHNQPFLFTSLALYAGASVVLCERFRPELTLDLVPRFGVTYLNLVPTMMGRMLRADNVAEVDLSSLETVLHMAAPCPDWVKRGWIDLVGPQKVLEIWAATELTGITMIRGTDWLTHPGSVGPGLLTDFRILDADGNILPTGEVGEIWSRFLDGAEATYDYLGAGALDRTDDGFISVGDLGSLDEDGYLYLADRRTDLIITGGANVYPAEVEAVISAHPGVADVAVIGLPDDDLGRRVHAVVQRVDREAAPTEDELRDLVSGSLASYKVPRGWEFVDQLPRTDAGKLRRSALLDERVES